MASLIAVMGESGSGKTTSLRTLDPSSTFIIDCDKKGLPWRGWRSQYNKEAKNYIVTDSPDDVLSYMRIVNLNPLYKNVKVLVVDTMNGIMVAQESRDRKKKGYDKWADLAWCVYDIIDEALTMREDLTIVFMAHSQTDRDDNGVIFTRIKTSGRKLDKIVLESKFTTVLNSKSVGGEYVFVTHDPASTAKTPMGCFDSETIPNDMLAVVNAIREYEGIEPVTPAKRSIAEVEKNEANN